MVGQTDWRGKPGQYLEIFCLPPLAEVGGKGPPHTNGEFFFFNSKDTVAKGQGTETKSFSTGSALVQKDGVTQS